MMRLWDALGSAGFDQLLRSVVKGTVIHDGYSPGQRSALFRMHNEVARRERSRYPMPVPPSEQHKANERRRTRGW